MWILKLDLPVWLCMPVAAAIVLLGEVRLQALRMELEQRLRTQAEAHAADARRLTEWHDGLWRRWQSHVAAHARHYDRYWEQICIGMIRVYTERAGDARLHTLLRGALQAGTAPKQIAHGLAVHYADDPEFVRRFSAFAARGSSSKGTGRNASG